MRRKVEVPPKFTAPRDPEARGQLRAKANRRWPHPVGTAVWVTVPVRKRKGVAARATTPSTASRTRSKSFFNRDGHVVVLVEGCPDAVRACHLTLRPEGS